MLNSMLQKGECINMSNVLLEKSGNGFKAMPWNRIYTIDEAPNVLASVISNGKELLSKPMALYMESNGKEATFQNGIAFKVDTNGIADKENVIIKAFESESAVVNIEHSFFEDGLNKVSITLMPKGRSIAQNFGLEGLDKQPVFKPNKLYLDVYLNSCCAEYYHVCPINPKIVAEGLNDDAGVAYADFIPKNGFRSVFREQIYVNGDNCGLAFIFRDDEKFEIAEKDRAVEFIKTENGENILRFHLLDRTPSVWDIDVQDVNKMLDMPPITFRFGVIATPVKEFKNDGFYERNLHIDCFKKIPKKVNYDEFLAGEVVEGSGEIGYDRLARLGVKVLYLHEKWNDIQNSPFLTEATVLRAKTIVRECHKRGIKVIPYFGYEFSSLSPLFPEHSEEFWQKHSDYPYAWYWYRYPYQRDICACLGSDWSDYLYKGLTKIYDEIGFDGLYFDSTVRPAGCKNITHGCGYIDSDGNIQPTHPVWEIREFIKKIYAFVKSRGGTVNIHGCGAANMAVVYYQDSLWEGEIFQGPFLQGKLLEMPEGMLRGQFTGRDTGSPVYSLCYSKDGVWSFRSAAALYLLHGSVPKPVDIGEPLEQMSKIWDILDKFPLNDAAFKPYWLENDKLKVIGEGVKASCWETDEEMLVICASTNVNVNCEAQIKCEYKNIFDALRDYEAVSQNGAYITKFSGIDYKMFYIKK